MTCSCLQLPDIAVAPCLNHLYVADAANDLFLKSQRLSLSTHVDAKAPLIQDSFAFQTLLSYAWATSLFYYLAENSRCKLFQYKCSLDIVVPANFGTSGVFPFKWSTCMRCQLSLDLNCPRKRPSLPAPCTLGGSC